MSMIFRSERILLLLLITDWELRTGRVHPPRPPAELSGDELVDFWADPLTAGDVR
jgi:hypothetical protein